jgi:hypothetical protein
LDETSKGSEAKACGDFLVRNRSVTMARRWFIAGVSRSFTEHAAGVSVRPEGRHQQSGKKPGEYR